MSSLTQRGGRVNVRVGGNTQDYATLVPSLPNGKMIQKQNTGNTNPVGLILSSCLVKVLRCSHYKDRNADIGFHGGGYLHAGQCFGSRQCPLVPR